MNNSQSFAQEIDQRIAKYDLLCHPFYKAWSMGELTQNDLRDYACDYYHHVQAFPGYLEQLENRLPEGEVKAMVRQNREDEEAPQARSHAELWLDFAEGMGADRSKSQEHTPIAEISSLIESFNHVSCLGSTAEALAAFYAYESQIPRVAAEKEMGLKQRYGADDRTAYYFTLHKAYDIQHSKTWLQLLTREVGESETHRRQALRCRKCCQSVVASSGRR